MGNNSDAPYYWMREQDGLIAPVVEKFLNGNDLGNKDILILRGYLRQWIDHNLCNSRKQPILNALEESSTNVEFINWLEMAAELGIDPF